MNTKYILWLAFTLMAAAQLFVPVKMIADRENVLANGKQFLFKTRPIDPSDPFRGKYITLDFEANTFTVDSNQSLWKYDEKVYVSLYTGKDGFVSVKALSKEKPTNEDYVKARIAYDEPSEYRSQTTLYIYYPFDRYYMEETKAQPAENAYRSATWDSSQVCYAVVCVQNGEAVLKDVRIDGKPIKEVVENAISEP